MCVLHLPVLYPPWRVAQRVKTHPIFSPPRQGRLAAYLIFWACLGVAHVAHVEAVDVSLFPPCQASSIPPVAGYVSQNNLVLDAGEDCEDCG